MLAGTLHQMTPYPGSSYDLGKTGIQLYPTSPSWYSINPFATSTTLYLRNLTQCLQRMPTTSEQPPSWCQSHQQLRVQILILGLKHAEETWHCFALVWHILHPTSPGSLTPLNPYWSWGVRENRLFSRFSYVSVPGTTRYIVHHVLFWSPLKGMHKADMMCLGPTIIGHITYGVVRRTFLFRLLVPGYQPGRAL